MSFFTSKVLAWMCFVLGMALIGVTLMNVSLQTDVAQCEAKFNKLNGEFNTAVEASKAATATATAQLTEKLRTTERQLTTLTSQLETSNEANKVATGQRDAAMRDAVLARGGLRDPGARSCNSTSVARGSSAGGATPAPSPTSEATGVLSEQAAEFLFAYSREAEDLSTDYRTLYEYKEELVRILNARSVSGVQ